MLIALLNCVKLELIEEIRAFSEAAPCRAAVTSDCTELAVDCAFDVAVVIAFNRVVSDP